MLVSHDISHSNSLQLLELERNFTVDTKIPTQLIKVTFKMAYKSTREIKMLKYCAIGLVFQLQYCTFAIQFVKVKTLKNPL